MAEKKTKKDFADALAKKAQAREKTAVAAAGLDAEKAPAEEQINQKGKETKMTKPEVNEVKRTKKVLLATPEATPFAHSGGLGEVASSMPISIMNNPDSNVDIRVIMPLWGQISDEYREKMTYLGNTYVNLSWRSQYAGLFELKHENVTFYFIDNEYYFKRNSLYGYYDDCERFVFFSKAIFEVLPMTGFAPDIIHANDWQTAMVPVYQACQYKIDFLKTIITIHNIEYQGSYGSEVFQDILGLPGEYYDVVEYDGGVNLLKGAIQSADIVSTVSASYAEEIKTPEYSFGLDPILNENAFKLRGILNGIDTVVYNPRTDKKIAANYDENNLEGKAVCKRALQEEAGLPVRDDIPLVAIVSRLVDAKGTDLIVERIDEILNYNDMQFIVLGTGFKYYEDFFKSLQNRHPGKVCAMIKFNVDLSHRIYAGADLLLMPSRSEPCGLSQMIACTYGTVPLVRETGGLKDSIQDCTLGEGSGFVFSDYNADQFHGVFQGAIDRYWDRENWINLVKHDLTIDFSWDVSALEYDKMYNGLIG